MKKLLIWAMVLSGIMLGACTSDDDATGEGQLGRIYGIVTELGTAEPMKAVGVELYGSNTSAILLKTVTFDDGHFEFSDLNPGNYQVKVVAEGYEQTEKGYVTVEEGRQARIDLQVKKIDTRIVMRTQDATVNGIDVMLNAEFTYEYSDDYPTEVGFVYANQNNPRNGGTIIKCQESDIKATSSSHTKTFSAKVSGLGKGTYYYQAYAINSKGKTYGEVRSFTMSGDPAVSTLNVTNITSTSATLNGRIDYEGEPAYTEHGFVYSKLFPRPTVEDASNATTKISISGRSTDFSANVSSLTVGALYYVRAYATYEGGTVYGEVQTFIPSSPDYMIIDNLMVQKKDLGKANRNTAQQMCKNSRIGGYSDWRLPTLAELSMLYMHKDEIGGFVKACYWSDYVSLSYNYYYVDFTGGSQGYSSNSNLQYYVRAVRTIK